MKFKRLFNFKYPKTLLFVISIALAYWLFSKPFVAEFMSQLNSLTYLGVLIAGLFFSFGFTAPFAIGFFITAQPDSLLLAALVGALGALISDIFIFKIIRISFIKEFRNLEKTYPIKKMIDLIDYSIPHKIRVYLLYAFAGIIIASPLPDEIGVTMLAGLTTIRQNVLAIISFSCNFIGIFIMLLIGQ